MLAIWKPVPSYEGLYEISDLGQVRSVKLRGKPHYTSSFKLRKLKYRSDGYLTVCLCKEEFNSFRDSALKCKDV